jgi:hypothetical protein
MLSRESRFGRGLRAVWVLRHWVAREREAWGASEHLGASFPRSRIEGSQRTGLIASPHVPGMDVSDSRRSNFAPSRWRVHLSQTRTLKEI